LARRARSSNERHRGVGSARSVASVRSTRSPPAARPPPKSVLTSVRSATDFWLSGTRRFGVQKRGSPGHGGRERDATTGCDRCAGSARHRSPLFHIGARLPSRCGLAHPSYVGLAARKSADKDRPSCTRRNMGRVAAPLARSVPLARSGALPVAVPDISGQCVRSPRPAAGSRSRVARAPVA
jgi:hypothetical protein